MKTCPCYNQIDNQIDQLRGPRNKSMHIWVLTYYKCGIMNKWE